MEYLKEKAIAKINTRALTSFLALGTIASVLPFFIHIQWMTGPIINAILILVLFLVGRKAAVVTCVIPSLMALFGGLIPPLLAPVIPFIMVGNIIFVLTIDYFYNNAKNNLNGYFLGSFIGATLKAFFIFFNMILIVKVLMKNEVAMKIVLSMGVLQFFTAVVGGMLAFIALKWLKRI